MIQKKSLITLVFAPLAMAVLLTVGPSSIEALELSPQNKLSIQNSFLFTNNKITGPKPGSSFLTPGKNFTEDLGLAFSSVSGGHRWEAVADGRATDDDRIERNVTSLKRFFIKEEGPRHAALVGDVYGSFSQYSLNATLKGARWVQKFSPTMEVTLLGGINKSSWEDLWDNKTSETVDRNVAGARFSKTFSNEALIAVHGVTTGDARAEGNTTATAQKESLGGAEWALPPIGTVKLSGESAYARTETDPAAGTQTVGKGWAHLGRLEFRIRRFRSQNELERVSPDFATTVGAAAPDLIRARSQNRVGLGGPWVVLLNYSWYHNNLDNNALVDTARTIIPEAGVRYEAPDWRSTFSAEAKARLREVSSSLTGVLMHTRSLVTGIADRLGPANVNVDYELQDEVRTDGSVNATHHIVGVGLNSLHRLGATWKMMPSLRWNLQRDHDNRVATVDESNLMNAGLVVQAAWGLDIGGSYSRNYVQSDLSPGSDRRIVSASAGYNWLGRRDHRIEARYRQNDNRFDTPGQNYRERIWEGNLVNRF